MIENRMNKKVRKKNNQTGTASHNMLVKKKKKTDKSEYAVNDGLGNHRWVFQFIDYHLNMNTQTQLAPFSPFN